MLLLQHDGGVRHPMRYATVEAALSARRDIFAPQEWHVRTLEETIWHKREARKCNYNPLPPSLAAMPRNPDHYVHLSQEQPGKLAYTPDNQAGLLDRQKRTSIEGYVTKYFRGDCTPAQIAEWTAAITPKTFDMLLLTTAEQIRTVYTNGPAFSSCMRYAFEECAPHHPVDVYGDSDLQLAIMVSSKANLTSDCDPKTIASQVLARTVVWPAKKRYARIYSAGKADIFAALLNKAGYKHNNNFNGAKVRYLENHNGAPIGPYLDCGEGFYERGEWLEICDDQSEFTGSNTNGFISPDDEDYCTCERCDGRVHMDDTYSVSGEMWCMSCEESHTFYCHGYREAYPDTVDSVECDGFTYSMAYAEQHLYYCEASNSYHREPTASVIIQLHPLITQEWCEESVEESALQCPMTGEFYADDVASFVEVEQRDGDTIEMIDITLHEHGVFLWQGKFYDYDPCTDQLELPIAAE